MGVLLLRLELLRLRRELLLLWWLQRLLLESLAAVWVDAILTGFMVNPGGVARCLIHNDAGCVAIRLTNGLFPACVSIVVITNATAGLTSSCCNDVVVLSSIGLGVMDGCVPV